jgi:hypothetical protein
MTEVGIFREEVVIFEKGGGFFEKEGATLTVPRVPEVR